MNATENGARSNGTALLRAAPFPLNVYARALELEEGHPDYLRFGLYETPDMPAPAARRRSTELLWRHLPPPCRLLEIGSGFGATVLALRAAGYAATDIASDAAQLACAGDRQCDILPPLCARLENFTDEAGRWDVMLFHESAQSIEPLDLFTHGDRLLTEHGEILILDQFALRRTAPGPEELHLLQHFIDLAQRFGFVVVEQLDLTRQAAPTLDYLLHVVPRHVDALRREFGITSQTLDALNAVNVASRQKYADGRAGYFLLKLRRVSRPRWRVGRVDGRNSGAMRALFAQIFGHPMSEFHWRWKYGEERCAAFGVWEGERLIAHYAGVARDILYFGKPQSAAQIGDLMVAPSGRGTLSRRGPLFLTIATYLENQLGYGNPHLLGVGCPNLRHWKVAARLGLYGGPVGRMLELSWPAARGRPWPSLEIRRLDLSDDRDRADAEACWSAMRADLKAMIVGVRDSKFLHHRYVAHPEKRYCTFVVRRRVSDRALGLFVLNPDADGGCELMDVVGPRAAMPLLLVQACCVAASLGATRLFCWVVDNIRTYFGTDAQVRGLDVVVPTNSWTPGPPIEDLIGKWWLTGGDTDFR